MAEGEHRRNGDQEILRVRENVNRLGDKIQELLVRHTETAVIVGQLQETFGELKGSIHVIMEKVGDLPDLTRRLTLLERIVFGACALILVAVVTAIVSGAVIVPNLRTQQELRQLLTIPPAGR